MADAEALITAQIAVLASLVPESVEVTLFKRGQRIDLLADALLEGTSSGTIDKFPRIMSASEIAGLLDRLSQREADEQSDGDPHFEYSNGLEDEDQD